MILTPEEIKQIALLYWLEKYEGKFLGQFTLNDTPEFGRRVAKAQLAKVRPDREKIIKDISSIITDARSTAYADAMAGKQAYRIGTMDFIKGISALFDEEGRES